MWSYISLLVSAFFFFSFSKLIVGKISYGLYIYIYTCIVLNLREMFLALILELHILVLQLCKEK